VFVGIEEGVDGMVHKSDLSWSVRVNNPSDLYQKGDDVEAIILSINHDEKKVSLGIKQLWDDPWPSMLTEFPMGRVFEDAPVVSIVDYGVFVGSARASRASSPRGHERRHHRTPSLPHHEERRRRTPGPRSAQAWWWWRRRCPRRGRPSGRRDARRPHQREARQQAVRPEVVGQARAETPERALETAPFSRL
jgi:hypothetical protein